MKKKIKGTPMYMYKGDMLFEKPKGTRAAKMKYDSDEDITLITVKKNYYFLEFFALLAITAVILLSFVFKTKMLNDIQMSKPIEWYNGNLNINLTMGKENHLPVEYNINGVTGILVPGEVLSTIECQEQPTEINVKFTSRFLIFSDTYEEVVPVYNLSMEE